MFRYHFLGHFLAEFNEICCPSLFNSILKTYIWRDISLNILLFLFNKIWNFVDFLLCFWYTKCTNYATKVETLLCVSSFVCLLHVHATFNCIWRSVKVITYQYMYLGKCPKSMATIFMETKYGKQNKIFSIFFHADHNILPGMYNEMRGWKMSKQVFRPEHPINIPLEIPLNDKMRKPSIKLGDDCLISIDTATQMFFSIMQVLFRYNFLSHFSAELNAICCRGSRA